MLALLVAFALFAGLGAIGLYRGLTRWIGPAVPDSWASEVIDAATFFLCAAEADTLVQFAERLRRRHGAE